jgi:hypothetical protein
MPEAPPVQRRLRRILVASLTLLLVVTGTVGALAHLAAVAAPAAAAPKPDPYASAKHAAGYTIRGQWFGSWRTADGHGFCIEFDKGPANSNGTTKLDGNVPQMSKEESARVRHITNAYGRTTSKVDGAAAAIFVWQMQGTRRFDDYYAGMVKAKAISKAIQNRVSQMAAEARNYGPFRLSMTQTAGYVGQSVTGTVTVRAHNGKPVRGLAVRLSINGNGALASRGSASNAQGKVTYTARVTKPGSVQVRSTLVSPSGGVLITRPSAGHQRLVLATAATAAVTAEVASLRSVGGPTVVSTCTADCDGSAPVTVTMTNPCGSAVIREHVLSDGAQVGSFDVAACATGTTTLDLPDDAVVTTTYCYLDAQRRCVSTPRANPGSLRVVCPALVQYRFTGACPCAGSKTVTYSVQAPAASTRSYTVTQVRTGPSGRDAHTVTLRNGVWQPLPAVALRAGDQLSVSVTVAGRSRVLDSISQVS